MLAALGAIRDTSKPIKVYFSRNSIVSKLKGLTGIPLETGFGRLETEISALAAKFGFIASDRAEADLEFFLSQPHLKIKPEVRPGVIYTMTEFNAMPRGWLEALRNWDVVLVPSKWCKDMFESYGIRCEVVRPGVNSKRFRFARRSTENWTYLAQSVYFADRKQAWLAADVFRQLKLRDANLIIKTVPFPYKREDYLDYDLIISGVRHINRIVSDDELLALYHSCQVSVNPSIGEGFGFLPLEHMATGMCTILPNHTGFAEFAEFGLQVWYDEISNSYVIDPSDLASLMEWTYKCKELALKIGEAAARRVRQRFSWNSTLAKLRLVFAKALGSVEHRTEFWTPADSPYDWVSPSLERTIGAKLKWDIQS